MIWWVCAYCLVATCLFVRVWSECMPWERDDAAHVAGVVLVCCVWPLVVFGMLLDWMYGR